MTVSNRVRHNASALAAAWMHATHHHPIAQRIPEHPSPHQRVPSADGRWSLVCNQRAEKEECVLLDLHRQYAARRLVLPCSGTAHTPAKLQHSFVMLTTQHPSLLQCHIQSLEPLRQVQVELVCSEHLELIGHCYDRQIDGQLFQKDLLPDQFNAISWRIDMPRSAPAGSWLCTVILTACNNAGQVGHHVMPLDMIST